MRVISGIYKNRSLGAPEGKEITRPTGSRIKESLFNILAPEIEDTCVLDLFSGSGSLGIEALSRGAQKAVFVENHRLALTELQNNIDKLEIPKSNVQVITKRVEDFLSVPSRGGQQFDIVFADPPYTVDWASTGIQMLEDSGYCTENCLLVLERATIKKHHKNAQTYPEVQNWTLQDIRKYGKTQLEFWRRNYD